MANKKRPAPAKSELEIARIVWELGEATVRQVHEALPVSRGLDFWTVQTYLRRLKSKGYLRTRKASGGNVYLPAVKPHTVVRELVNDFLDRVFDGEPLPLFQQLIEDRGLTASDIDQLQTLLDRLREEQK